MQNGRPNHSNRPVISLGDENDYVYPQETWNFSNKNLQNSNYLISRSPSMFEGHSGTFLLSADRLDRTFQESSHLEQSNNSFSSPHRGNPRSPSPEPVADETQIEALREVIEQKKLEIAQLQSESTQLEQKIIVMQNYAREQRISELFSNETGQNGARSLGGLMIENEETHLKRMLRTQIDDVRESKTVITFMKQMNKGEPISSRLTSYLSKRISQLEQLNYHQIEKMRPKRDRLRKQEAEIRDLMKAIEQIEQEVEESSPKPKLDETQSDPKDPGKYNQMEKSMLISIPIPPLKSPKANRGPQSPTLRLQPEVTKQVTYKTLPRPQDPPPTFSISRLADYQPVLGTMNRVQLPSPRSGSDRHHALSSPRAQARQLPRRTNNPGAGFVIETSSRSSSIKNTANRIERLTSATKNRSIEHVSSLPFLEQSRSRSRSQRETSQDYNSSQLPTLRRQSSREGLRNMFKFPVVRRSEATQESRRPSTFRIKRTAYLAAEDLDHKVNQSLSPESNRTFEPRKPSTLFEALPAPQLKLTESGFSLDRQKGEVSNNAKTGRLLKSSNSTSQVNKSVGRSSVRSRENSLQQRINIQRSSSNQDGKDGTKGTSRSQTHEDNSFLAPETTTAKTIAKFMSNPEKLAVFFKKFAQKPKPPSPTVPLPKPKINIVLAPPISEEPAFLEQLRMNSSPIHKPEPPKVSAPPRLPDDLESPVVSNRRRTNTNDDSDIPQTPASLEGRGFSPDEAADKTIYPARDRMDSTSDQSTATKILPIVKNGLRKLLSKFVSSDFIGLQPVPGTLLNQGDPDQAGRSALESLFSKSNPVLTKLDPKFATNQSKPTSPWQALFGPSGSTSNPLLAGLKQTSTKPTVAQTQTPSLEKPNVPTPSDPKLPLEKRSFKSAVTEAQAVKGTQQVRTGGVVPLTAPGSMLADTDSPKSPGEDAVVATHNKTNQVNNCLAAVSKLLQSRQGRGIAIGFGAFDASVSLGKSKRTDIVQHKIIEVDEKESSEELRSEIQHEPYPQVTSITELHAHEPVKRAGSSKLQSSATLRPGRSFGVLKQPSLGDMILDKGKDGEDSASFVHTIHKKMVAPSNDGNKWVESVGRTESELAGLGQSSINLQDARSKKGRAQQPNMTFQTNQVGESPLKVRPQFQNPNIKKRPAEDNKVDQGSSVGTAPVLASIQPTGLNFTLRQQEAKIKENLGTDLKKPESEQVGLTLNGLKVPGLINNTQSGVLIEEFSQEDDEIPKSLRNCELNKTEKKEPLEQRPVAEKSHLTSLKEPSPKPAKFISSQFVPRVIPVPQEHGQLDYQSAPSRKVQKAASFEAKAKPETQQDWLKIFHPSLPAGMLVPSRGKLTIATKEKAPPHDDVVSKTNIRPLTKGGSAAEKRKDGDIVTKNGTQGSIQLSGSRASAGSSYKSLRRPQRQVIPLDQIDYSFEESCDYDESYGQVEPINDLFSWVAPKTKFDRKSSRDSKSRSKFASAGILRESSLSIDARRSEHSRSRSGQLDDSYKRKKPSWAIEDED